MAGMALSSLFNTPIAPKTGGVTAGAYQGMPQQSMPQPQAPSSSPNMMFFGEVTPGSSGSDFNDRVRAAGGSAEAAPSYNPATGKVEWSTNLNYKPPSAQQPTAPVTQSYPSHTVSSGSGGSYSSFPSGGDGGGGGGAGGGGKTDPGAKIVEPPSMSGLKDVASGGPSPYDDISTGENVDGPSAFRQGIGTRILPQYMYELAQKGPRNY